MRRWIAPRAQEGGDHELTIKIIGGLPEQYSPASELPPIASSCVYSSTFRLFSPAVGPGAARLLGTAFGSQTGP